MSEHLVVDACGLRLTLDVHRAAFWEPGRTLFVSDTHFGKDDTARDAGIPLPRGVLQTDLARLKKAILSHRAREVWILGDAFDSRSVSQETMDQITQFVGQIAPVALHMIPGNHDRSSRNFAHQCGIAWADEGHQVGPWTLRHQPPEHPIGNEAVLCGHAHPGVAVFGPGRDRMRLPCFVIAEQHVVLPAFSEFTGLDTRVARPQNKIYAAASTRIVEVPQGAISSPRRGRL